MCSHKLDKTGQILQVKQIYTFSFLYIFVNVWMSRWTQNIRSWPITLGCKLNCCAMRNCIPQNVELLLRITVLSTYISNCAQKCKMCTFLFLLCFTGFCFCFWKEQKSVIHHLPLLNLPVFIPSTLRICTSSLPSGPKRQRSPHRSVCTEACR